jgi:uncharacterized protein YpmS
MINTLKAKIRDTIDCVIIGYLDYRKMKKWKKILWLACLMIGTLFIMNFLEEAKEFKEEQQSLLEESEYLEANFFQSTTTQKEKNV